MTAYYNEFDPKAAAWLRQLIKNGLIADGVVDERSITEVTAGDLRGFNQAHWFAGIGGWSNSLGLAGIPDDYPVWTASLPCQPFSVAGQQKGKDDERHLLPYFLKLVRQCKPNRIFGEQVEGAIRHGWLDDLQTTMEAEDYAVGYCVLGAHSVGSFHQRQRLYWVADSIDKGSQRRLSGRQGSEREIIDGHAGRNGAAGGMGNTEHNGHITGSVVGSNDPSVFGGEKRADSSSESEGASSSRVISGGRVGNPNSDGLQARSETPEATRHGHTANSTGWDDPEWLYFRDNKYRAIKSGIKPLVDGVSERMVRSSDPSESIDADNTQEARVMRLKGYGNAIVPQVAATFIKAVMDVA